MAPGTGRLDDAKLVEQLVEHEGERLKPYRDSVGKLTIGVGRNLDDRGITQAESRTLLDHDIATVIHELNVMLAWWVRLDDVRRRVLADMAFNLGVPGLLGFRLALAAMKAERWSDAAAEMLDSKWARQVGRRARRLAEMMRTGRDVALRDVE